LLLQQEEIENEEARKYIDILAERSERLKHLIEDLIEASKATTGNLSMDMGIIQLDELVKQIIGEYSDKIEEQGLDIIYSRMEKTSIIADGKHMWRVVENLVNNIIKYTMQSTRVYIDVFIEEGYGILTMKNVSKEPLNVDPAELTKRFVRGDESRTEEGFGLGLAIADSLVQLQKGKFEISIDGDLFKVCIKIPVTHN
jgi:signal transduction histidine kinase